MESKDEEEHENLEGKSSTFAIKLNIFR